VTIPYLSHAYHWSALHWKLWGVMGLLAAGARAARTWFDLQKARAEDAKLRRELKVEGMMRTMAAETGRAKAEHPSKSIVVEIKSSPDDDLEIFQEAKRRRFLKR
jgi:hypothetical protein